MSEQESVMATSVVKKAGRPRRNVTAIDSEMEALKARMAELEQSKKLLAKQEAERVQKEKATAQLKAKKEQLAKREANFAGIVKLIRAHKLHEVDVSVWTEKLPSIVSALK